MLNNRQTRFCDDYLANGGNAYQAAIDAGYAESTARIAANWLSLKSMKKSDKNDKYNAEMAEYIAEQSDEIERHNENVATAEDVQTFVSAVMKGETIETVIANNGKAVKVPANIRDRLRAAYMLAKMKGMFTEQISAEINTPVVIVGYDDVQD